MQLEGEKVRALRRPGVLGRGAHHPGPVDAPGGEALRPPHPDVQREREARGLGRAPREERRLGGGVG